MKFGAPVVSRAAAPYKAAEGSVGKPNAVFSYLDTKTFFERSYGTLKPYAITASFMMPQVNDYVDPGKLPEPDVIAKHLSSTVLSESYNPEGCLLESVGSITFGQVSLVLAGGAVALSAHFAPGQPAGNDAQATPIRSVPVASH